MPGVPSKPERAETVMLRLTAAEKAAWKELADYKGISALVRTAVKEFVRNHPKPKAAFDAIEY